MKSCNASALDVDHDLGKVDPVEKKTVKVVLNDFKRMLFGINVRFLKLLI